MNLDNNPSWVQWSLKGIWTWSYGCSLWWAAWVQWPLWLGQAGWGTLVRHHQMKWFSMRNPKVLHWHFQSKWMFSNDNPWNFQCYLLFINHPPLINPSWVPWSHQAFGHEPMDLPLGEVYGCHAFFDWDQLDQAHWGAKWIMQMERTSMRNH